MVPTDIADQTGDLALAESFKDQERRTLGRLSTLDALFEKDL